MQADIAAARDSVLLAGWAFEPAFRLTRGGPTLRQLLAQTAERAQVRVLAWAGAPLPLFTPSRAAVRSTREALVRGTKIEMALDARERPMHCHHEKLAVIDGRVAYVGGIDLTSLAGDRLDSRGASRTRRDRLARRRCTGRGPTRRGRGRPSRAPLAREDREQLEPEPAGEPHGSVRAQFVRTIPNSVYDAVPRGDFRILEAYMRALRAAQRFVYLESQFLWAPELVAILADKLRRPPSDEFRIVVVLPAKPRNGADDTRGQLGVLVDNDPDGRLLACTLYQPGRVDQVYVHAKIGIVDDRGSRSVRRT